MVTDNMITEETENVGTLVLKKSDGSNYYTLKTTYDEDRVAFSPNEDYSKDAVAPMVTQLRNAKEVAVKVLDKDKKVVRTIGNVCDIRKLTYSYLAYGMTADGFMNYATGDYVNWDGKLYNTSTGKYEVAKDGQYYIQIEAKRTKDSLPEITTMPVKIDTKKPELKEAEVTKEGEDTILTFTVKDDNAMGTHFFVDVYGEDAAETIATTYAEATIIGEGKYSINLGGIESTDEVTLMIEDEAGNTENKTVQVAEIDEDVENEDFYDEEFDDEDYDIDMEDFEDESFELCEGVTVDKDLTSEDTVLGAVDVEIYLAGTIEKILL